MLPRRHSPVAITLGITALLLSPGLFFLTEAQTYDIDSFSQSQGEQQYRQCMIQAVNAYENERLQAYRQYHDALENGYQQRLQEVQQAWQIPDSRTRSNALRDIDREFRTFERDLSRMHKERLRDADRVHRDATRACDDEYRAWKRDTRYTGRSSTSSSGRIDYSRYPSIPYRSDPRPSPFSDGRSYGSYDQTSYYGDLLNRSRQQSATYGQTQTFGTVTRTYSSPTTNIRCGDGICQAGEWNVCPTDCQWYNPPADGTWYSTYVDGYGYVAPVQLQY